MFVRMSIACLVESRWFQFAALLTSIEIMYVALPMPLINLFVFFKIKLGTDRCYSNKKKRLMTLSRYFQINYTNIKIEY